MSEQPAWGEGPSRERVPSPQPTPPVAPPGADRVGTGGRDSGERGAGGPDVAGQGAGGPDVAGQGAGGPDVAGQGAGGSDTGFAADPLNVIGLVFGVLGLLVAGPLLAVITAILAAEAGRQAREAGRPQRHALWIFGLAVLDAVVWIVLHLTLDLTFLAG